MSRVRQRRFRAALLLIVGVAVTALGSIAYATDALKNVELDSVDARFSIRGERAPPDDLVVVKVDDVTFQELDRRWPFPRSMHADVVRRIAADRPKAIGYDVQFTEPSAREEEDLALLEAILDADGRVVLATTEVNERGETKVLGGDAVLREVRARAASGQLPPDPGGVLRRISHSVDKLETLPVAVVETASRRQVDPDALGGDTTWIDYHGPPGTIPAVSFSKVARGRTQPGLFRNKIVVVGPSAGSLQDVHPTSSSGKEEMAGVEIQANAISTVRRGFPLQSAPAAIDLLLLGLLALAPALASMRLSPVPTLAVALALGATFAVTVQLAFDAGTVLSFTYPLAALVLSSVGALAIHYLSVAVERERVRDLFSRFVPEEVVRDVLAHADGLRLGGVQRQGTVMFTDLRGFTSFAESMRPDQVIDVLNQYLSAMSDAILDHGGTLVAYMGDGIMAVFGAPIEQDDHADRALAAAREMLGVRLPRFNEWLRSEGLGDGFRMGIGLNSGRVMSGNVGSERRVEYAAVGDTTNTAARIEGITKGTPHQLLIADSTRSLLEDTASELLYVDEFEVRGREAKIRLWTLPDEGSERAPVGLADPA